MEQSPKINEQKAEYEQPKWLTDSLKDFLKENGLNDNFVPIIQITENGSISIKILDNGKVVFGGYNVASPFSVGKEGIIKGAKEAISFWIKDMKEENPSLKEIAKDISGQQADFIKTGQASDNFIKKYSKPDQKKTA